MLKKISLVLFWNLIILLFLVVLVELSLGYWFYPTPRQVGVTCFDPVTHHKYCENVHQLRYMAKDDGGELISTYVSQDGIAVEKPSNMNDAFNIVDYEVIIIGDSFIQAEEIKFEDRIGSRIEDLAGVHVLTHGYSSWAPVIQTNWLLTQNIQKGQKVIYFVMSNDFTPSYANSNLSYHRTVVKKNKISGREVFQFAPSRSDEPHAAVALKFSQKITNKSFFLARTALLLKSHTKATSTDDLNLFQDSFEEYFNTCDEFYANQTTQSSMKLMIYDYLVFSQKVECWQDAHRAEVISGINDIRRAKAYLDEVGAELYVYLIPSGWAFPGENMIGKASAGYFNLAPGTLVSQQGLAAFMTQELNKLNINFTDLEPVIKKLRNKGEEWYFPVDGHWTELAHERLASYLVRDLNIHH